ncbi:MAG: putative quinol monooxygenase [Candidatus Dormibacteraceae bacterium]
MVIVTGSAEIRPQNLDEAIALCLEHVRRSRDEPGCISHAVHQDAEYPCRLFFFEQWADRAALAKHFAMPRSGEFVVAFVRLAKSAPEMSVYDAERADS